MKYKSFWLFAFALIYVFSAKAQNFSPCATPTPNEPFELDQKAIQLSAERDASGYQYVVKIFVHILRNNDGSNPAMSVADLETNLTNMANYFHPHNICFALIGQDFIDNTEWNTNYKSDMINALHAVNPHTDAIDIYVHANNFESSGGSSYDIPSTKCSISAKTPYNFQHEMGHCLGLYHTFETEYGAECPDGSNCSTAGDFLCDTKADFPGSDKMSSNCVYTGTKSTFCWPNSVQTYNPPVDNIMSYFESCYAKFTLQQGERMRGTLSVNMPLLQRLAPYNLMVSNLLIGVFSFGGGYEAAFAATNTITVGNINNQGDVIIQSSGHGVFNAGSFVQVLPGTRFTPEGTNSIVLRINDLCNNPSTILPEGEDRTSEVPTEQIDGPATIDVKVSPNPFNDYTTITYTLPTTQIVDLKIFSTMGTLVTQLASQEQQDAGKHEYTFEPNRLPPGVYFLVLYTNGQKQTLRLVLNR
ncbi:MAG: zinc-dependent metalloprotease [Saprospiraceae bacterium]|nr:zinc-dependent metalloprotease [Saprospiraceae bacterium]